MIEKINEAKRTYEEKRKRAIDEDDTVELIAMNSAIIAINECLSIAIGSHISELEQKKKRIEEIRNESCNEEELEINIEDLTDEAQARLHSFYGDEICDFAPLFVLCNYKEDRE